jgi:hypothetical protein
MILCHQVSETDIARRSAHRLQYAPLFLKVAHAGHYTLHPTLFTLHPTPYTLHPTPYTLHLTPYTLHPTP